MGERYSPPTDFPDEALLLGVCLNNLQLARVAQREQGLTASDFRHPWHGIIFTAIIYRLDGGKPTSRLSPSDKQRINEYIVKIKEHAAKRARGDEELARWILRDMALIVVGGIRTTRDRALWLNQLFEACGRQELSPADHLVGVCIARHVNLRTGVCYPSNSVIARQTGLSVPTIERSIPVLRKNGHVFIRRSRPLIFTPVVSALIAAKAKAGAEPEAAEPIAKEKERPSAPAREYTEDTVGF
jgi:hypothetical protein